MPAPRHLANAPIREALLDIRVDLPPEFSAIAFKHIRATVGSNTYPKMVEGTKFETSLQFEVGGRLGPQSTADLGLHSVLFLTADERTVAQFRTDGFTLNKLRPYTEWESIFPEAMRLWNLYVQTAAPLSVSRLGLRYINEFQIPGRVASLGRYLQAVPVAPPGAVGSMRGYLSRVSTEDEQTRQASSVTYSVSEQTDNDHLKVILDIDAMCSLVPGITTDELAPIFADLRRIKNNIFFESLTEQTLSLFQ